MRLRKTVVVDKPIEKVFAYLADFTTTTEWDPGTVRTVLQRGDGGVGTTYLNTSKFMGRETQLTYVVRDLVPDQLIRLQGENKTVVAVDTLSFRAVQTGTEVTYSAEFSFKGATRFFAPLLRPALDRLGQQAQSGLSDALNRL